MNKQQVYELLRERGVDFEVTEHRAVYNMDELSDIELPHPEADAKNLFVRDDKRRNYYLLSVRGDKRVDLKEFRCQNGTRPLTFASADELMDIIGLIPGAVTPLGVLNDGEARVKVFIDSDFLSGGLIGVHPCDNTATVWLRTEELIAILREHGNEVVTVRFEAM